jgi:hypothetical protein
MPSYLDLKQNHKPNQMNNSLLLLLITKRLQLEATKTMEWAQIRKVKTYH